MKTYSEIKEGLDLIAARNSRNLANIEKAIAYFDKVDADLDMMSADFSALIADINAQALANPSEPAFINAKSEKDQMVEDYQAMKTRVTALISAVQGI